MIKFLTTIMLFWCSTIAFSETSKDNSIKKDSLIIESINAKKLAKNNKKNPNALVNIGRVFFEQGDTTQAIVFAELAKRASKQKYAPAFILLGDIASVNNDSIKAIDNYNKATFANPKDPIGYYKFALVYRKISPKGAVQKLADLKSQRPDIEIDALSGHIYYLSNEFEKAREAYGKVPVGKMEKNDIVEYAKASYFLGKHTEGLEKVKDGLVKNPRNADMNRLAMYFNSELGFFDEAAKFGDAFFNKSDSANFSYLDYFYLGNAFNGLKQADKAIEQYNKALELEINSKVRRGDVIKNLSDAYADKGDFLNAIKVYKVYLKEKEELSLSEYAALGALYSKYADNLIDVAEKESALKNADSVYQEIEEKYKDAIEYANYMRATVNWKMDSDLKKGLALPFYEKIIKLIAPKIEKSNTDKSMLTTAYNYLMSYNFHVMNDKAAAKQYAKMILEIDPEHASALQIKNLK